MGQVFLKVINMSISAGVLIIAILLIRLLLKRIPKWIMCLLWGTVAIRLLWPFSIESKWSLIPWNNPMGTNIYHDLIVYNTSLVPVDTVEILEKFPVTGRDVIADVNTIGRIWILGVLVLFLYALISYAYMQKKVSESIPKEGNIFICDNIDTSFLFGFLFPKIYLPSSMEGPEVNYAILHEKVHLERGDHLWKIIGFFIVSLHWFNPLVWIAYTMFGRDIELACDEKVISSMSLDERKFYANAILSCSTYKRKFFVHSLYFGKTGTKERIKAVRKYRKVTTGEVVLSLAFCVVVAICFLTDPIGKVNIVVAEEQEQIEILERIMAHEPDSEEKSVGQKTSYMMDIDEEMYPMVSPSEEGDIHEIIGALVNDTAIITFTNTGESDRFCQLVIYEYGNGMNKSNHTVAVLSGITSSGNMLTASGTITRSNAKAIATIYNSESANSGVATTYVTQIK